ncbi:glycosyltransferase [Desulfovibrio sp. OttesenSCG-928-O18]|nr:glycosyltransferase [Desulfovibrio sp. OttesenSCG-928-O18]
MSPLLSIVIPVYNVEPYLATCLESVVGQNIDQEDYEILVIDDKSTDGSLVICNDFAARHPNIRVFPLPENTPGGAGFPSNIGIKNATGKYIGFVDSDDYASPDMFRLLLDEAERTAADITVCSYWLYGMQDGSTLPPDDAAEWPRVVKRGFDALPLVERKKLCLALNPVPWRKLYRREFLEKNRILYPVGDFFYEDIPLHWFTVTLAETMAFVDRRLITHRVQRAGQTVGESVERMTRQMLEHVRTVRKFLMDKQLYETYSMQFWSFALFVIALVPPSTPLHREVAGAVADICGPPPEGVLDHVPWAAR